MEINKIYTGDCLEELKKIPDSSVDAIVTDPPYELGFMGKTWDNTGIANNVDMWKECLRVLKPGGHLLSFGGTRTYHRMASAIEDAGFEIRDMIEWVYGSGFPKSLNIGKAVDKIAPRLGQFDGFAKHLTEQIKKSGKTQKQIASLFPSKTGGVTGCVWNWANGANVPTLAQWHILKPLLNLSDDFLPLIERIEAEREYIGTKTSGIGKAFTKDGWGSGHEEVSITKGTSEWEGWGTALKPAHEPICMARKPLSEKTVAENVLKYGTGALDIDGCRIPCNLETEDLARGRQSNGGAIFGSTNKELKIEANTLGRFPANLIHDGSDEVRECFPEVKGKKPFKKLSSFNFDVGSEHKKQKYESQAGLGETGNASRFFKSIIYTAKASKSERNRGCEGLEEKQKFWHNNEGRDMTNPKNYIGGKVNIQMAKNTHPTVKPIALMEYLINMVTKEGQTVLDPFTGSGTTLIACKNLGRNYIGIELEPEYVKIAEARIRGVTPSMF